MVTLKQAIILARTPGTAIHRALNQLDGCPVGGWAQTAQAVRQITDECPRRTERDWSVGQLVESVMQSTDWDGRWHWRDAQAQQEGGAS